MSAAHDPLWDNRPTPEPLERPPRPSLPPPFWFLVATVACARVTLEANGPPAPGIALAALGTLVLAAAALCLTSLRRASLPCALVAAGALAGTALALANLNAQSSFAEACAIQTLPWSVVVEGDPSATSSGWVADARVLNAGPGGRVSLLVAQAQAGHEACPIKRGDAISCSARFTPNGDDEWGRSRRVRGIGGSLRVGSVLERCPAGGPYGLVLAMREWLAEWTRAREPGPGALIGGCVLGIRDGLKADGTADQFAACGLSHLIAVSGSHLAVVGALLVRALSHLRATPRARRMALALVLGTYVVLSGLAPSALRAWLMSLLGLGSERLGRRGHSLSAVCLAAIAMCALNVGVVGELGYLLSVTSVVALCVFARWTSYAALELMGGGRLLRRTQRKRARAIRTLAEGLASSLVCLVATLPLTASAFGQVSLMGPVANLLLGAPFGWVVMVGFVACVLSWVPWVGDVALFGARAAAWVVLAPVRVLASLPYAQVDVSSEATAFGLFVTIGLSVVYAVWPRVNRRGVALLGGALSLACLLCLARWRYLSPPRVVVLDVGQGDAILVQDGACAVLVDAGPEGALAAALAREHVTHLDGVLITHQHADHYAGLSGLSGLPKVEETYVAQGVAKALTNEVAAALSQVDRDGPAEVRLGDVLHVGGFTLEVVWPEQEVDGQENSHSICLKLTYLGRGGTLEGYLTGDAESAELERVLAAHRVGDIDFLKVGHHGSKVSITAEQARTLNAEVAVASAGEGNSYGHPARECVGALEESGSVFLCTKDVGDVVIEPGAGGPRVSCARGGVTLA